MFTIGIDIGTTNCKVCLFSTPEFELVNQYSFKTPKLVHGQNTDFDIELIWKGTLYGLNKLSSSLHAACMSVSAIAVASVGEAGVLLDDKDKPIGPTLTWYDTRPKTQLNKIIDVLSVEDIYRITGIPAHSNYSVNKIKWLQDNISAAKDGCKWLCLAEYIAFRLSGEKRSEYSLASRTMALNLEAKTWDTELLTKIEIPPEMFCPLVYAGTAIGTLTQEVAELTGLPTSTSVAIAGHDHMCGSVAVGLNNKEQILNSTGTTEGLLVVTEHTNTSQEFFKARVSNGVHVLEGFHSLYASLPSAGYAIEWFRTLFEMDMPSFLRLVDTLNEQNEDDSAANQDGIFIPHLRGSGPPERNTWSKALLYGMDDKSRPEEILRFIFQGLCFELRNLLDSYEALTGRHYPVVNVIGAACKNPYWLQLKATILNREVVACNIEEAVSRGAAMLAAKAVGFDLTQTKNTSEEMLKCYVPDSDEASRFDALYQDLYKPLYESKMLVERRCYGES
ncbi:FGGY-family carbohydrate kinase [Buttiauxella gaviniae]|uniref:FGGY-family carbohydrate kinase n=1 Tax=Buttiauxella gaviniae TaxID=82990 RepID=UPI003BB518DF